MRSQRDHFLATVRTASAVAEGLIQVRSMFVRRYPHLRAVIVRVKCGCAGNLAHIADGVLVSRCIPIHRLPSGGYQIALRCLHESGDVLRIERVAMPATVSPPEMITVDFNYRP